MSSSVTYPAWQAGKSYTAGDKVNFNNVLFVARANHTASTSFKTDEQAGLWLVTDDAPAFVSERDAILTLDTTNFNGVLSGTDTHVQTAMDTIDDHAHGLTAAELAQLANIDGVTISGTQWGYLGALDQGLTTTSSVSYNKAAVNNGDDVLLSQNTYQIRLGFYAGGGYSSYITTRHSGGGPSGNSIDFYLSDGTAAGVYPTNAVHGMSIESGGVGIGTTTPAASAKLDLTSTTRGFLPPRMTTTQRDAISTPATGLIIFNTTTAKINFYNGSAWEAVTSA